MEGTIKSPRPIPLIFNEGVTFSHKKSRKKDKNGDCLPPRPPIKSAPPVSRLFKNKGKYSPGPQSVSFRSNESSHSSSRCAEQQTSSLCLEVRRQDILSSPHYNSRSKELYFEQCFEVISRLGAGSFGEVYKVKSKEDGCFYAIKKSRDRFRGDADRRFKLEEVNKHEKLKPHPNCVRFIRAWEERQHLYIQTELCEMSLSDYSTKYEDIKESVVWDFLVDLTMGLKHLHDIDLVHMDLKPANIFIGLDGLCKIGDFGLVLEISKTDMSDAQEGDPKYLAPELLQGSVSKAADIFSLGITMLELACDMELPRGGESWHQLRSGRLPNDFTEGLSLELRNLITKMMDPIPQRRPTVEDILMEADVKKAWKRRQRLHIYSWVLSSRNKVCHLVYSFFVWLWAAVVWPFQADNRQASTPVMQQNNSFHHGYDSSFVSDVFTDSNETSGGSTPEISSSFEDLANFVNKPPSPHHESRYHSSPVNSCGSVTPCSHISSSRLSPSPLLSSHSNSRLTPPLDCSSPGRLQYTPPSETRRVSHLFDDDDDLLSRSGVGPKNLLGVFEEAAYDN